MERRVLFLLLSTVMAVLSLCRGKEPSSVAKMRKVFKNSKTQGFYYKTVGSDDSLASASKAVFKEFLKKHKISNPKKYLKDWKIVFDQGDVPTGLEHDMEARMRMIKTPTDIKAYLYMDQLFNRNGGKNAEKIFKKVFANEDIVKFAMYTMGDGKNVHGTMVAAESKANKGFFLIFMESLKLLEKEYTKRD